MKSFPAYKILILSGIILMGALGCKKKSNSTLPTVTTTQVSAIDTTTAMSGGNVTSDGGATVTARGVCWSIFSPPQVTDNKTTDGQGTGVFTSTMTGLTRGTLYYVRAYATNINGTGYGVLDSLTTLGTVPVNKVTTLAASNILSISATLNGSIDSTFNVADASFDYGLTSTYGTSVAATLKNLNVTKRAYASKSTEAQIMITANVTGLAPYTMYHFRAKVVNSLGTTYGNDMTFLTNY